MLRPLAVATLILVSIPLAAAPAALAAPSDPADPADPADGSSPLDRRIARFEASSDPEHHMVAQTMGSIGYHSTVKPGTRVHATRTSLDYALALLARGRPEDRERAARIVRKVLSLQDTDPSHRTYGIWPWYLEEPLERMSPPDWNWADFCGARLAQMLHDTPERLPDPLRDAMRRSLRHAARAIRRRDVGPGYTNIAIMGGGVSAAAGEILEEPELLAYGRARLEKVVRHTAHHGGFNEYNSPTYTLVALEECERALHLVRDPGTREAAEALRRVAWRTIAESWHPASGQWAGPHSRAYSDRLRPGQLAYLARATGLPLTGDEGTGPEHRAVPVLPCPPELVDRFRRLPSDPLEMRRTFQRRDREEHSIVGTTWLTRDACLGSVSDSCFWTQRRPLIAYWAVPNSAPAVLRARVLRDGRDFSSVAARHVQRGARALSLLYPRSRNGDWHIHLDRPADGVFRARDLRLRYELDGADASAHEQSQGVWQLASGSWHAVVHVAEGASFAGTPARVEASREEGRARVDIILHHGEETPFDFPRLGGVRVAVGLEILPTEVEPTASRPRVDLAAPNRVRAEWVDGLEALAPYRAGTDELALEVRSRVEGAEAGTSDVETWTERWDASRCALIICDMWQQHWCRGATERVVELAPRIDALASEVRARGGVVIHAPSGCMEAYRDHPARRRALETPPAAEFPEGIDRWCHRSSTEEGAVYPIDQSDGGCDCEPTCPQGAPWKRQIAKIEIADSDHVSDGGKEIWSILEHHGVDNVLLCGVHTNMCVLGRPFGLRNLSAAGKNVVLVRDLTDTMYNSRRWPWVSHFRGTDLIVEHIERHVCKTAASSDVLGGEPLRFAADARPRVVIAIAEREYETRETLPAFARKVLEEVQGFSVTILHASPDDRNDIPALAEALEDADLLLVSVRRRALPRADLEAVRAHIAGGGALVGIRTASHAFDTRGKHPEGHDEWRTFDPDVLGGSYHGHYGRGIETRVSLAPGAEGHPITRSLELPTTSSSSLYRTSPLATDATPLLLGRIPDRDPEPVAWARTVGKARVFYTSLGGPDDFRNPQFVRLLRNGILWSLDRPLPPAGDAR